MVSNPNKHMVFNRSCSCMLQTNAANVIDNIEIAKINVVGSGFIVIFQLVWQISHCAGVLLYCTHFCKQGK